MSDSSDVQPADLRADCRNCFALCCVVLPFAASADFAFDKPAGTPCRNLGPDLRCTIHANLRERGFSGCTVYDCQGAGQKVSQVTFGGRDWRTDAQVAQQVQGVYRVVRQLHEMLAHLVEARDISQEPGLRTAVDDALSATNRLTYLSAEDLAGLDVAGHRAEVGALLARVSERARTPVPHASYRNADLIGVDLRTRDLRRTDLRGALLIAADLRGVDLRGADLLGADLRDADLRGADLTDCLFLTPAQLQAAKGDAATRVTPKLTRPLHWRAGDSGR